MRNSIYHSKNYSILTLVILAALIFLGDFSMQPPSKKGLDAPTHEFSASRAFETHSTILKDIPPHPVGTNANTIVRDRITARFKELGFEVEHQPGFNCDDYFGVCTKVINIIVLKKGKTNNKALMITGHYDSVPAGQGASDDGMGVATIMEVARIAMDDPQYENDVVFLITDGEEVGLSGAVEFVKNHPLSDRIGAALSIESRGTDGPSSMFETSENNNGLVNIYKANTSNPVANSLFYEIYKRMPNDTDYSIFKKAGMPGLNYANSQAVVRYHSEYDDLNHMGQDTLQHHGDNILGVFRALANTDLAKIEHSENAIFFDLFGMYLVKWSASTGVILGIFSFIAIIGVGLMSFWNDPKYGTGIGSLFNVVVIKQKTFAFVALLLVVAIILGLGWLLSYPLGHWLDLYPLEHPYPWPSRVALFAAGLISILLVARLLHSKIGHLMNVFFVWSLMALGGLVLSFLIPGISYILLFPSLVFVLGLAIDYLKNRGKDKPFGRFTWASHLGLLAATYIGVYHYYVFDVVLNFQLSHFKLIPVLIPAIVTFPVFCELLKENSEGFATLRNSAFGLLVLGTIISQFMPTYTLDRPRGMNLNHIENATDGTAKWVMDVIGNPDEAYLSEAGFEIIKQDYNRYGLQSSKGFIKGAEFEEGLAPDLTVLEDKIENGTRIIKGEFRSQRGGYSLMFGFMGDTKFTHLKINGQIALTYDENSERGQYITPIHGLIFEPASFEIEMPEGESLALQLIDFDFLTQTQDAASILKFRPDNVKPIHGGDRSIIYKTFKF